MGSHAIRPNDRRKRDLAAIHAGAKQLGMDEETRRALIERITGKRSSGALCLEERKAVLKELWRLGARGKPGRHPGKPHNFNSEPMLERVEQLLTAMRLPWAYADQLAKHMYRIDRCAWLKTAQQLSGVIAALDCEWHRRAIRGLCEELGMPADELLSRVGRSNRVRLGEILDELAETRAFRLAHQPACGGES